MSTPVDANALIRSVVWDYDYPAEDLLALARGEVASCGHLDRTALLVRVLERLPWYSVLAIVGLDEARRILDAGLHRRLRHRDMREKYERVRAILRGETLPPSGWDPEGRGAGAFPVLSHRWYGHRARLVRP